MAKPPQVSRSNTAVIEARVDVRVLATIITYLNEEGMTVRSRSELIRSALENLAAVLIAARRAEVVGSTSEALAILARFGINNVNRSGRGRQTLAKKIGEEFVETAGSDEVARALRAHRDRERNKPESKGGEDGHS